MKYITFVSFVITLSHAAAWIPRTIPQEKLLMRQATETKFNRIGKSSAFPEMDSNPCWEDIYDDDCAMSSAFYASFVAAKWIKSMPCAQGLEDCDMPDDLKVPETRPEAGIDHVDVMTMLGMKRARSLEKNRIWEDEKLAP